MCARSRLPAIIVLAGLAACDAGPRSPCSGEVVVDLAALLPFTDDAPRTEVIRPGDPAYREHLLRGWSAPVTLDDGTPGARIVNGRTGTLVFHAGRKPHPVTVHVERRLDPPEPSVRSHRTRRSRMVIDVNGQVVRRDTESLEGPDGVYHVPVELVQAGRNLLSIRQVGRAQARPDEPPRPRWVYTAVRFDAAAAGAPAPRVEGDRLLIPSGAEANVYFRAPLGASLCFGLEAHGVPDPSLRLRATLTTDAAPKRPLFDVVPAPSAELSYPLDVEPGAIVRLTLALGERGDPAGPEVVLRRPVIEGRRPATTTPGPLAPRRSRPNVVLYVADTLRADRLGAYGRVPSLTPEIDRLAAEGIVFDRALAQSPWTRPSTATILTGRYPATHGAITLRTSMRRDVPTLADMLGQAGWATAAFVTNLNVAPAFGFGRGFGVYDYIPEDVRRPGIYEPANVLHEKALTWIDAREDRPFFLYLHASDPHAPYRPVHPDGGGDADETFRLNHALMRAPRAVDDRGLETLRRLYDAETEEFDAEFGRFRRALAARGIAENTLFVFVADHGEEFREHGALQHGHSLYQEVMRVPLIVRLPGGADGGRRVPALARHVDLVPTVLAVLGLDTGDDLPGVPLPFAGDGGSGGEAIVDTWFGDRAQSGLVVPPWKVVLPRLVLAARPEVYDLERDPEERHDVARAHPVLIGYAKQRTAEIETAHGLLAADDGEAGGPHPEALQRLRALGYVVD